MFLKSTAHMRSNGNPFCDAWVIHVLDMQGKKNFCNGELGYYRVVLLKVTMHSKVRLLFI